MTCHLCGCQAITRINADLAAKPDPFGSWVGVTKPILSTPLFSMFFRIIKALVTEYHVHIWLVSPQTPAKYECDSKHITYIFPYWYGEINGWSFSNSNPHPRPQMCKIENVSTYQSLPGENLQQLDEHLSIA